MPKVLFGFKTGQTVRMQCYHHACKGVVISGTLGRDETDELYPGFNGSERFTWKPGTPVRLFRLENDVRCQRCNAIFASATIVSNGKRRKPTIFGYEAEGC